MTPAERARCALDCGQPDKVPHFELEMQLTQEYCGKDFIPKAQWEAEPERAGEFLKHDAELFVQVADTFDYSVIFYSFFGAGFRPDWETYVEGIRVLRELDGGRRLIMCHGDSTMGMPDGQSMADFAVRLFDNRDEILEEQEHNLETVLQRAEEHLKAGADGFIMCCDYCFNSGPFLSPQMFGEFVTPFLKRLIAGYREMGAYAIKHTDGDIMPILDQLVECAPHGLHSIDSMAGVDIAEVKRICGDRVCLIGNVSCATMQTGTDEEILESCRYAMESAKPGGGYIFSTSNCIFRGVPTRAYDLMIDYWRKNRDY